MNQEKNKGAEYDFYGKLPLQKAILLGLQHVFAMFVGNLTPVLIITGACGIASGTEFADVQIALLQNAMLIAGIVTLIQLYAIGPIGGKVPIIMGTSSGFIGVCSSVASVMGGAMFGDNLSFISDTTIAACNGQGCAMKDKFKENFWIAFPAALVTLIIILILSFRTDIAGSVTHDYNLIQIIPYVLVLIGGIAGFNVFLVLLTGIVSGTVIVLATGNVGVYELIGNIGSGVSGMFETSIVAILVSAMCALIREYGGFEALLSGIRRTFKGKRGGQLGVGLLVGAMDIATANNTVAIVMANPIAKEMSENYGISNRKTASLLDTFSCVFQGIIPYGAQMLVAISAANELGYAISAFQIIPVLFYPLMLLISSLIWIFVIPADR